MVLYCGPSVSFKTLESNKAEKSFFAETGHKALTDDVVHNFFSYFYLVRIFFVRHYSLMRTDRNYSSCIRDEKCVLKFTQDLHLAIFVSRGITYEQNGSK